MVLIGRVISPPDSPSCTITPRGRTHVEGGAQAHARCRWPRTARRSWPLSAAKRPSAVGLLGDVDRLVGADLGAPCAAAAATTSVATMCAAPARRAAMITSAPIGPQPVTSTELAQQRAGAVHGVQRHRQRLGHRAFGVAHAVGQRVGLAGARRRSPGGTRPAHAACASRCRSSACPGNGSAVRAGRSGSRPQGRLGLIGDALADREGGDARCPPLR